MTNNPFQKASKKRAKLRLALMGTSGSGKTYTALTVASALGKTAVIDTEHGSASKYADRFDFDVLELSNFHPDRYIDAIHAAASAGYDVVVIDSLSHAWNGTGGALEIVDRVTRSSKSQNSYMAWADVTPLQNKLIEAIVGASIHVIATLRSKTEYVLDRDERGKTTPRKVGLAPVQRDGMEYEFDVVGEMDMQNTLVITKSRVPELANAVMLQPGKALGETLLKWLEDGAEAPQAPATPQLPTQPVQTPPVPASKPAAIPAVDSLTSGLGANVTPIEDAPNVYFCEKLRVNVSRTATMFLLQTAKGNVNIVVPPLVLAGVQVNGKFAEALAAGVYPLNPAWKVTAELEGDTWRIDGIDTGTTEGATA